jgi:DNA-binding transcriptional ArsR family regulator
LSLTFGALADPTRRATLQRLAAGTANVKELSRPFDMSGPTVCKHLRVLERAGLIAAMPARPRAAQAGRRVGGSVSAFWDASFDRLDGYLHELQARRGKEVRGARRRKR